MVVEQRFRPGSGPGSGAAVAAAFWSALDVWTLKPQVVNRRLWGCRVDGERVGGLGLDSGERPGVGLLLDLLPALSCRGAVPQPELEAVLTGFRPPGEEEEEEAAAGAVEGSQRVSAILRTVIVKGRGAGPGRAAREIVLRDFTNNTATFIPLDEHDEESCAFKKSNIYRFKLCHVEEDAGLWSVSISILCPEQWESDGMLYPKTAWLTDVLLSKIVKWSTENKKSIYKSTLSLISLEKYSECYHQLKEKYKEMVKVWPEVTDPEKFVYEDVAIATYLLVLWEHERAENNLAVKQSFIDLGCGNGLLVHILSNEGHPGRGIDVRKRKIWDMYGPQTHLEEHAITPSDSYLFPDVDWIIGNHSDELTPWIPLIAARSSYGCRYFVLPCCFFDFYGKYCRRQTKKTQYREYLDFITEVGSVCGFEVEEDCLRIPSTKRVCLLGKQRIYPPSSEGRLDEKRTQYIRGRLIGVQTAANNEMTAPGPLHSHDMKNFTSDIGDTMEEALLPLGTSTSSNWVGDFQPREKIEKVKNCATLPRDFIDGVVLHVANALLNANQDHQELSSNEDKGCWNKGGCLPLKNVADLLDRDTLQRLKKECGGLKTLLRNNYQVFEVVQSNVQIRDWTKEKQTRRPASDAKRKLIPEACKTRLCWFFANHPDGCPRSTENCPFAHGTEELKPRTNSKKKN